HPRDSPRARLGQPGNTCVENQLTSQRSLPVTRSARRVVDRASSVPSRAARCSISSGGYQKARNTELFRQARVGPMKQYGLTYSQTTTSPSSVTSKIRPSHPSQISVLPSVRRYAMAFADTGAQVLSPRPQTPPIFRQRGCPGGAELRNASEPQPS